VPSFATCTVTEVLSSRVGLQRVLLDDGAKAFVLTDLIGDVAVGDEVVVNTTGVELGLGSGGWHVVHWNLSRQTWGTPGRGHVMKLRYTSLQADTGAGEEVHGELSDDLGGMPVVVGTVHSQVPGVAATVKHLWPECRVAYVMTDGAALPIAYSDLVDGLRERALVDGTVTVGHAFGGDVEAVNVPAALTLARHALRADIVVVAMGPGVVGTGTRLGTTALEAVPALDAVAALGGRPVLCVRVSTEDSRHRHQGVSHHSRTVLDLVRSPVDVALPADLTPALGDQPRHRVTIVEPPDVGRLLDAHGLRVTTMGRGAEREPGFFAACGAAGMRAVELAERAPGNGQPVP
jgi:Protein of unknown function (DUF3866)